MDLPTVAPFEMPAPGSVVWLKGPWKKTRPVRRGNDESESAFLKRVNNVAAEHIEKEQQVRVCAVP